MKKVLIYILLITAFMSCEDTLDLTPRDSLSDADFWANETTIQGYVDYAYHMLQQYTRDGFTLSTSWGHFRGEATDEAMPHLAPQGALWFTNGTLTPESTNNVMGSWTAFYEIIQHVNRFFDNYDQGRFDVDEDKLTVWLGEMHFLRAWYYNQLIKMYGGVILSSKPFTSDDPVDQVRSSYDDCVEFILADLEVAISNLPTEAAVAGRVTSGVAMGLKAQVLVHAASLLHNPSQDLSKWEAAATATKAVLDLPQYSLYQPANYPDIFFHNKSQGNTELMLGKYVQANIAIGNGRFPWFNFPSTLFGPSSYNGFGIATPSQQLVDAFQMADGTPYDRATHGDMPYEDRELRFYSTILYDGAEFSTTTPRVPAVEDIGNKIETGVYTYIDPNTNEVATRNGYDRAGGTIVQRNNYTRTGYYCNKYVKQDWDTTFASELTQQILMRFTEFYLLYAECLVMLDRGAEARDYLLPIRQRAGLPDSSLPAVITMDEVMHESRIELAFEGQRFFDVRRWMILDQTFKDIEGVDVAVDQTVDPEVRTYTYFSAQQRTYDPKLYYLPIYSSEIERNPLIDQNDGW